MFSMRLLHLGSPSSPDLLRSLYWRSEVLRFPSRLGTSCWPLVSPSSYDVKLHLTRESLAIFSPRLRWQIYPRLLTLNYTLTGNCSQFFTHPQGSRSAVVSSTLNLPYSRGIAADFFLRTISYCFGVESTFLVK
jgi:hypothetical protein